MQNFNLSSPLIRDSVLSVEYGGAGIYWLGSSPSVFTSKIFVSEDEDSETLSFILVANSRPVLSGTHFNAERVSRDETSSLFSPELARKDGFIESLKLASLKNVFRKKAKRYHPDVHGHEPADTDEKRRERFIKIRESQKIFRSHIVEKYKSVSAPRVRGRKIIAKTSHVIDGLKNRATSKSDPVGRNTDLLDDLEPLGTA